MIGNAAISIDWQDKIFSYVRAIERPFTTSEILQYALRGHEDVLNDKERRRNYMLQASLILNRLCERKVLYSEDLKGYKGKIYGLMTWKDKPEHQYYFEQKTKTLIGEKNRFFAELH